MTPVLLLLAGGAAGILAQKPIKRGIKTVAKTGISAKRSVQRFYSEIREDLDDVAAEVDAEHAEREAAEAAERATAARERANAVHAAAAAPAATVAVVEPKSKS